MNERFCRNLALCPARSSVSQFLESDLYEVEEPFSNQSEADQKVARAK